MINVLLLLATTTTGAALPSYARLQHNYEDRLVIPGAILSVLAPIFNPIYPLPEMKAFLEQEAPTLNADVVDKVLTTLKCSQINHVNHNNILTVIDYSLPSNEKRLWVFDLQQKKRLFHTYVSHGIKSGLLETNAFSNKYDSKATSMGIYTTEKSYYGHEGISLRLNGLDRGFNDNASNRYIVMHGGWYVAENFIQKYGRPGRSWGCPAVPIELAQSIINTIKENSLYVSYYRSDAWFVKSKFLNCEKKSMAQPPDLATLLPADNDEREGILFVDLKNNNKREETAPVVTMAADKYEQIFHTKPPVTRMLRRQINGMEYIALSDNEFKNIHTDNHALNEVSFVRPNVKMVRGYYVTEMLLVPLGKIKSVTDALANNGGYALYLEGKKTIKLKATTRFIRWVGL